MKKFLGIFVFLMFFGVVFAQSQDTTRTITVNGVAEVEVIPDICTISLGVFVEDPDPVRAMSGLSDKMSSILRSLALLGIKKEKMKTANLQLEPIYEFQDEKQVLKGFRASEDLVVSSPVNDAGKVLAAAVKAGVNRIGGILFDYSGKDSLQLTAIELAMKDARVKAERALAGSGYNIKGIKTINIQWSIPSVPLYRAETFAKSLNEVPIEQGTMKISVSVFVVFNFE